MIAMLINLITGQLMPYIAGAGALVFGALGLYFKGRKDARQRADAKVAEAYIKTRERMDDADLDSSDDPGVLRQWLHARRDDKQ